MTEVDIWRRLYIQQLEARIVLCEIRRATLNLEIDSPIVALKRKAEAVLQRDQVLIEWGTIMTELEEQKGSN
jgi:hypothetical protein